MTHLQFPGRSKSGPATSATVKRWMTHGRTWGPSWGSWLCLWVMCRFGNHGFWNISWYVRKNAKPVHLEGQTPCSTACFLWSIGCMSDTIWKFGEEAANFSQACPGITIMVCIPFLFISVKSGYAMHPVSARQPLVGRRFIARTGFHLDSQCGVDWVSWPMNEIRYMP